MMAISAKLRNYIGLSFKLNLLLIIVLALLVSPTDNN